MTVRVVVADDQDVVRAGLGASSKATPASRSSAKRLTVRRPSEVQRPEPDVCLMDIRMPVLDGLAATGVSSCPGSGVRVVILTTFDLDEYVYEALRIGASGFLLKDAPADDLVRAVHIAARGEATLAPSTTQRLIVEFAGRHQRRPMPGESLTAREEQVLVAMARGLSNIEIGRRLYISEGTVRTHINRLLAKLGVRDRLQAVVLAYECGLVEPGHTAHG